MNPTIRLAVIQTPGTRLDQWPETRSLIDTLITQAAAAGADLALLPECVWPAYYIESVETYHRARASGLPGVSDFLSWLQSAARREHIAICAGYVAERDNVLSNEVVLMDASGEVLGTHAKCFLWDFDNDFFCPGNALQPVPTPWGLVGLMICADARLPEIPATLVSRGARLLLQPTAWVNVGTPSAPWNPQPTILIPDRAREFGIPIASASKWGKEGPTEFVGSSLICDSTGTVLTQCGTSDTEMIVAEVALGEPYRSNVTVAERDRLLSFEPATTPRAEVPALHVVSLSRMTRDNASPLDRVFIHANHTHAPTLVIADHDPKLTADFENALLLTEPASVILESHGIRIASLTDADAERFAPLRVFAMDGIHAAVVFGKNIADRTLRARAAENRIFVINVAPDRLRAYSPLGVAIAPVSEPIDGVDPGAYYRLDVSSAANKEFAPLTNPFRQRRPAMYHL